MSTTDRDLSAANIDITEGYEHRHQLTRECAKAADIVNRVRTELLQIHTLGGGAALGDYELEEMRAKIPTSLNEYNRDLLFRAIEILSE